MLCEIMAPFLIQILPEVNSPSLIQGHRPFLDILNQVQAHLQRPWTEGHPPVSARVRRAPATPACPPLPASPWPKNGGCITPPSLPAPNHSLSQRPSPGAPNKKCASRTSPKKFHPLILRSAYHPPFFDLSFSCDFILMT